MYNEFIVDSTQPVMNVVFGTHFATPSAGKVAGKGKHFQFEV
jgi:hypothetical protein